MSPDRTPAACCPARRSRRHRADRDGVPSARPLLGTAGARPRVRVCKLGWAKLKLEVERRDILNSRDLARLTKLLAEHPELATTKMEHWCDHKGAQPLAYMAMLRFDHDRLGLPRQLPGTGAVAKTLIDAGAPVNGHPGTRRLH